MSLFKPFLSMSAGKNARTPQASRPGPFSAVEIRCSASACGAAKRINHKRFLAAEAPRLPLASCTRPAQCTCRYRHLDDRREGPRRLAEIGVAGQLQPSGPERRKSAGRRAEDLGLRRWEASDDSLDDSYYDYVNRRLEE